VARDNKIRVDDEEKQQLESIRQDMFGDATVPMGVVIQQLANHWERTDKD